MNGKKILLTSFCISAMVCMGGCRSGKMGSRGLFGFGGKPSAEKLAGEGPTTTYPVPPSASATPEAIASIAGGTIAPSTLPTSVQPTTRPNTGGFADALANASNGAVAPAAGRNMSAAQANGFYGGTKPVGFAASNPTSPQVKTPSYAQAPGYQFGGSASASSGTFAPSAKTASLPTGRMPGASAPLMMPKEIKPQAASLGPKMNSFAMNDLPANNASAAPKMSMPAGLPESAFKSVPAAKSAYQTKIADTAAAAKSAVANLSLPSVSVEAPSNSATTPAATSTPSFGGYAPGSTNGSSSYPAYPGN